MDRFEEVKLRIKDATDLVALVQSYIPLQSRGRLHVALCPFHREKTPSFTVYPDSQHFKCYGCGKAGDVFSFVQEREGLSFREAMELLGERAGIDTSGAFGRRDPNARSRADAAEVLGTVSDWFMETLRGDEGRAAREYLVDRGLGDAIDSFALGAHPAAPGRLREFARRRRLPMDVLDRAGLLTRGGSREPFRGRVMFPIVDERGRTVGFGGRVLDGDAQDAGPKYLNSPDSPHFNKRRLLFGLRQVKRADERRLVVVEGYTDVIAMHLAGQRGAVATLGTALTAEHAALLERYATSGVVLLFDGDRAGRQAADRAFRELVHTSLPVRIALLPEGRDPADLAAVRTDLSPAEVESSRGALNEIIDRADDAVTTWFRLLRQRLDLGVDANVQRAVAECARILESIESRARREALLLDMARHLGLTDAALRTALRRDRPRQPRAAGHDASSAVPPVSRDPLAESDLDLLGCLLAAPELARGIPADTPYHAEFVEQLVGWAGDAHEAGLAGGGAVARHLFACCGTEESWKSFVADAVDRSQRVRDPRSMFLTLLQGRRAYFAREKARLTRMRLRQALTQGDRALVERLTHEFVEHARKYGLPTD